MAGSPVPHLPDRRMNWIEVVAVVFGVICVGLTVKQSLWCWPAGLVQVTLYVYIFHKARLYSDMILHVIYVWLQIYGWWQWRRGAANLSPDSTGRRPLPVSTLDARQRTLWMVAVVLVAAAWGEIMDRFTDATAAHADAFIAAASLCAQYLLARKRLENWIVWIVVDVVASAVYWSRDLELTAALYGVFLGLSVAGFRSWHRRLAGGSSGAAREIAETPA